MAPEPAKVVGLTTGHL